MYRLVFHCLGSHLGAAADRDTALKVSHMAGACLGLGLGYDM